MDVKLSWDLFIIVVFAVIIAYSFIIGRNGSIKVLMGTYVAILAADGFGNLFAKYMADSVFAPKVLKLFSIANEEQAMVIAKIVLFILLVIFLSVRGVFQVTAGEDRSSIIKIITTGIYGFFSAALIISTVLVYISGASFIAGILNPGEIIENIYEKSEFAQMMIDHYNLWFSLPAIALILTSFISKPAPEPESE